MPTGSTFFLNYNKSHLSMTGTFKELLKEGKLYTGIVPLWLRQIPYTMVKFTTFEKIVEFIYEKLDLKKEEMNKLSDIDEAEKNYYTRLIYMMWPLITYIVFISICVHGGSIAVYSWGKNIYKKFVS